MNTTLTLQFKIIPMKVSLVIFLKRHPLIEKLQINLPKICLMFVVKHYCLVTVIVASSSDRVKVIFLRNVVPGIKNQSHQSLSIGP